MREAATSPLKKIGYPDQVAEAIHWLVSSAAMMTGSIVEFDFGMHLNAAWWSWEGVTHKKW